MFNKKCPNCGKDISFTTKKALKKSIENDSFCKSCSFSKKDKEKIYKKVSEGNKGKIVSEETKEKLRQINTGKKYSEEVNKKKGRKGKENSMYGRCNYDVWVEKYGKKIADKKQLETNKKISIATSGENNPMYGKPSPQGSGNGWSGWYKGFYFRSLKELSYLKYLFDNKIKFKSAEKKEYSVKYYDENEKLRTYFPDFYLIDSQEIIEIKPTRTKTFLRNKLKFKEAKKKYKDKFTIVSEKDYPQLSFEEIKQLYKKKDIVFIDRYEIKMKEKINETNKS